MPTYKVTDPKTGVTLKLTGDSPPTEAELEQIFKDAAPSSGKPLEHDFSAVDMVKNIGPSAKSMVTDMWQALRHPVQTAQGVADIGIGAAQKGVSAVTGQDSFEDDRRPNADALWTAITDRYGSMEHFQRSLENDPVGVVTDVAGLVTGAGLVTQSKNAAKIGAATNPINAAINTSKVAASKVIPEGLPASMYEDVAKFSTVLPADQRKSMVQTALDNKIMPTAKGVEKLDGMISDLNSRLDSLISDASASGKTIPKDAVYKHLKELRQQKGGVRLEAPEDLAAIDKIAKDLSLHLEGIGKSGLDASDLQKLKVEAYKSINWDARRSTGTPIKEDTYKSVARGAKEGVESLVPEVGGVNRQLGSLYELQPSLARSANRIDQRNMIPIDAPLAIGAGAGVGGDIGAAVGTMSSILGLPKIKAKNAIMLNELKNASSLELFLRNNPNISMTQLAAAMAGRTPIESDPQDMRPPNTLLGQQESSRP